MSNSLPSLYPPFKGSSSYQLPPFQGSEGSAQQILDTRYALGEISKEQYELMKQDLRG
jgi:hypothetical protein